MSSVEGPVLNMSDVSRQHMGAYLCIASNGVPPTVSKRIMLIVQCKWTQLTHVGDKECLVSRLFVYSLVLGIFERSYLFRPVITIGHGLLVLVGRYLNDWILDYSLSL